VTVHVTFVLPSFAGGGAERVVLGLLAHVDRARIAPALIVLNGEGPLRELLPADVPLTDLARPRLRHAAPALIRAIRRARPRAVVSTLGYVNLALLAGRRFLPRGTRLVVREANMPSLSLPAGPRPGLMRRLYRRYYPRADAVICSSRLMREEMARDFAVPPRCLQLLANPVDAAAIRAKAAPVPAPRVSDLAGTAEFVAAGRFTRQKGFDRLIELFAALPGESRLTILGDGPERAALEAVARGLGGRVSLPGFSDAPWPHYAAADAFLLPSRWEGMPNAALEALACGTPVIATPESGAIGEIAAAAPPGAVTLAPWGEDFAAALAAVAARADSGLRPSLLPPGHEPEAVARRLEEIVLGLA
jgi:glycosyltransferase involved in cell wall biosynthesis